MSRVPFSEICDVELSLTSHLSPPQRVIALAKRTWKIVGNTLERVPTAPLSGDWRDPATDRALISSSDFWLTKTRTDVIVQGSAIPARGLAVGRVDVRVTLSGTTIDRRVAVFGERAITWIDGRPRIGAPQPFEAMPITSARAFGGLDWRVAVGTPTGPGPAGQAITDEALFFKLQSDHPGMYPRNPFGRAYLVHDGAVPDLFAPNVEDPDDLLTAERLIVRDPAQWWRQPLPWHLDWTHGSSFPRVCWFGPQADAWFPAADAQLAEVRRGFVPAGFRARIKSDDRAPQAPWFQGANYGLTVDTLRDGTPVTISGMHAAGDVRFALPALNAPATVTIAGKSTPVPVRVHSIVIDPNAGLLTAVVAAECPTPRPFIPGVHAQIPISVRFAGEADAPYLTPPTAAARIAAAKAGAKP